LSLAGILIPSQRDWPEKSESERKILGFLRIERACWIEWSQTVMSIRSYTFLRNGKILLWCLPLQCRAKKYGWDWYLYVTEDIVLKGWVKDGYWNENSVPIIADRSGMGRVDDEDTRRNQKKYYRSKKLIKTDRQRFSCKAAARSQRLWPPSFRMPDVRSSAFTHIPIDFVKKWWS
jgi:hypothetical protein